MAKFLFHGKSTKQTASYYASRLDFNIDQSKQEDGSINYSTKGPIVSEFVAVDARTANIFPSNDQYDVGGPLTIGYLYPQYQTSDGQRAWFKLDLDFIANWFANKTDAHGDTLAFGYPLPIEGQAEVNIGDSLKDSVYMVKKKDDDGNWSSVVNADTDATINTTNADVYFYARQIKDYDNLIVITLNAQKTEVSEDISNTYSGTHVIETLEDNQDFALSANLLAPQFLNANFNGQSVVTCPKTTFKLRPFANPFIDSLGVDKSKIKLMFRTKMSYEKLDNGDWQFTLPDGVDTTYLTIFVSTKDSIASMETDSLVANFYVFRQ